MTVLINPGSTGIYEAALRFGDAAAAADRAAEIEALGFSSVWVPDLGGDLFDRMAGLLAATRTLTVASGVLNLWMHDAHESAARHRQLGRDFGDRNVLGVGVSHAPLVDASSPGRYQRPMAAMASFLDHLDDAPAPVPRTDRLLAALGPRMLELARERAAGALTFLVDPPDTQRARAILGSDRLLAVEQGVVLETDPAVARSIARKNLVHYFGLPNYVNNWLRAGYTDADVAAPGSDRLVDGLVAWGEETAIRRRVDEHRDAGADHVCVQVYTDRDGMETFPAQQWRRLADVLL